MITATDLGYLERCGIVRTGSDCINRQIGALVVWDAHTVGVGYNHNPIADGPSCAAACPRAGLQPDSPQRTGDYDLCIYVHAEAAAIIEAGQLTRNGTLYCTDAPCPGCWKLIHEAGIRRVVWPGHESIGQVIPHS